MLQQLDDLALALGGQLWTIVIYAGLALGIFYTVKTGLIQFSLFGDAIDLVKKQIQKGKDVNGVSGFQAFCVTLGGCIGTGNVGGVAMAILAGGPGVVPWMWLFALLGAGTSFAENTLAQVYKVEKDGEFRGGPAYYMWKGLGQKWLGNIYALVMIISLGICLVGLQTSSIALSMQGAFGISSAVISFIVAVLIGLVIFGGIKRITEVAEAGVPIMTLVYLIMLILVIVLNIKNVPAAFAAIFAEAVSPRSVAGATFATVFMNGIKRGVFSSGAGHGDAPTTGAAATVTHPVKQGLFGTLAIYMDTLVVCTATALVIIFTGVYQTSDKVGIELAQQAFVTGIGGWAAYVFALCIMMFCFTSIMANYYCGETCLAYLSHSMKGKTIFRIFFVIVVFLGGVLEINLIWDIADAMLALMIITNMCALPFLAGKLKLVIQDYQKQKKAGKDPVFHAAEAGIENTECWD